MMAVLSWIESIGAGRMGVGWCGRWGWVKSRISKHSSTNTRAVPSVGHQHWHNSQGMPGLPSKSVWQTMQSY